MSSEIATASFYAGDLPEFLREEFSLVGPINVSVTVESERVYSKFNTQNIQRIGAVTVQTRPAEGTYGEKTESRGVYGDVSTLTPQELALASSGEGSQLYLEGRRQLIDELTEAATEKEIDFLSNLCLSHGIILKDEKVPTVDEFGYEIKPTPGYRPVLTLEGSVLGFSKH